MCGWLVVMPMRTTFGCHCHVASPNMHRHPLCSDTLSVAVVSRRHVRRKPSPTWLPEDATTDSIYNVRRNWRRGVV